MTTINEYFLIPPNWADPVILRRRWQTVVQTSLKGNEQRSALFTWPRRTLSFMPLAKAFSESAYIKRKLHKNIHNVWGVPFWQDKTALTSQAASGQGTLNVGSTLNGNFEVGAKCILISSYNSYEAGTILSFTANQIVLSGNLSATWPLGTAVYPVLKARLKSGQVIDLRTSKAVGLQIDAAEEYDDGVTRHIGSASGFPTYRSYPIFDLRPDWADQVEQGFQHPYDYLAFYGKTASLSHYDDTEFSLKLKYLEKSKSDLQKIFDFFDDKMGRWGNLWIPSWQSDIRITQAFGAGDTQLQIENIEFSSYWLDTVAGANITMLWPDGTRVNRRVIGAPASTLIVVDNPIGKTCAASGLEGLLVSFMFFARFNQDEVEIQYHSTEIGETNLLFQSVFTESPLS